MKKVIFIYVSLMCASMNFALLSVLGQDLTGLQRHVFNLPENVTSKNFDWERPDYNYVYKKFSASWMEKVFQFFHLTEDNPWNIETLVSLLQSTVTNRKSFVEKSAYAAHITAKPGTKFVIWGDLFGAVHSLVRDLGHLHMQGVLNEQLEIVNQDYNFVFIGNVIDRSPYSLEILHIMLVLMERNPGQVFYIKGDHEANNYWMNFNLHNEIVAYFTKGILRSSNITAFEQLISTFFNSLPGALYISQKDSTHDIIALSDNLEGYGLNQSYSERFFTRDVNSTDYPLASNTPNTDRYHIIALIRGGQGIKTSVASRGLTMTEPYKGATTWSVISCPTPIYQKFFDIYYDAFVVLTIGSVSSQATLNLFYQDIRGKQGFNDAGALNIVTGESMARANQEELYHVGSTMDLTKGLAYMGQDLWFSMFHLIDESNKANYLPGKFIKLNVLDDEYVPRLTIKNVEKLINDYKVDTILMPVGSPTLGSYFELVKEEKVGVLFPVTGSPDYRKKDVKNIIHWRASYPDEARALVEYMITQNAVKKFAFFYQDDSYGLGPLQAAHELLKEKGITDWIDIPYNKAGLNFDEAIATIRKTQPDAIGLFSVPSATQEVFRSLGIEQLFNTKLFGISFIADDSFRSFVKEMGIKVLFSEVVPNPRTSDLEIVREFRAFMDKHNHSYDIFALEGYICTSLYLNALKPFKKVATVKEVIASFESYKDVMYKGLTLTFDPQYRDLGQSVWLEIDEDHWIEYKVKKQPSPSSK